MSKEYIVKDTFEGGKTVTWSLEGWQIIDRKYYAGDLIKEEHVMEKDYLGRTVELDVRQSEHNPRFVSAMRPDGSVAFSGYAGMRA